MKTFSVLLFFTLLSAASFAQEHQPKPKESESIKKSKVVSETDAEKNTAVPVATTKSTTPVAAEVKVVEEKQLKTESPKH